MRFLRTNTATIVTVGPFYDRTDGVTIETALTITNERISFVVDLNDGSAPTLVLDNVTGATSGTANDLNYIANCDAGLMQLELAAADVNYLGRAFLSITDAANHCPVFHEFMILPAHVYDGLVTGTDYLQVDSVQLSSDGTAADNAEAFFDGTGYAGTNNVIPTVTAVTNGVSLANDAITASKFDESTAFPLTSADTGATAVARAGADSDTLKTLSDQLDDVPTAVENADALLARNVSGGSSAGRTVKQALHAIRNKVAISGGTMTVYDVNDTDASWTAAVTGTSGADPITTVDPA